MTSHSDQDSEGIPHNSHAAQPVEQEVEPQTNEQSAPKADAEKPKPSSNGSVIELNTLNNQHQPKDGKFDSNITITFKDVSYKVAVPQNQHEIATFITPFVKLVKGIATLGKSWAKKDFYRMKDVSGVIKPGTMTLVLSPPGHGKSTYLHLLGNRIEPQSGHVLYNGRNLEQAEAEGCDLRKMTQYVDQVDTHLPLLTVTETLDFAHKLSAVRYEPERIQRVIQLLGLEECKDTIIGDALIRGVSGGQRKRVSTGEMLLSDANVLFLDEFSNGLDTATSEDIANGLRQWCHEKNASIVATLQQPTPGLFASFDRAVILREGHVVYDGPREDTLAYFEAMGFKCPDDVDVCDFIIDILTQPRVALMRQRQEELLLEQRKKSKGKSTKKVTKTTVDSSLGPVKITPTPCVTTEEMVDFYKSTPFWDEIKTELNKVFPDDDDSGSEKPQLNLDFSQMEPLLPTEHSKDMYKLGFRLPLFTMLRHVMVRQFQILSRNKGMIVPRMFNALIMSLIYGSLYWQIHTDNYVLRISSLLIALTLVGFGNMVELPVAVQNTRVIKKQLASNFYPEWAYVVSGFFASIPMSFAETCLISSFLYFMSGHTPEAVEFIVFFIIILIQSMNLSSWFRFLSAARKDEAQAQSIAGPSTGVFMIFGGFFVTESNLKDFMVWLYWISPFAWSTRALANNEFLSGRYDLTMMYDGVVRRTGDVYLEMMDVRNGTKWIIAGIFYLLGLCLIFMILHTLTLKEKWYEESIGTRRNDEEELLDGEFDAEIAPMADPNAPNQVQSASKVQQLTQQDTQNDNDDENDDQQSEFASTVASSVGQSQTATTTYNPNALRTLREKLPFSPTWLSFSNVRYTVKVQKDGEVTDRVLLDGISAYAEPGKMTALMGASGAGKTTLLDVLAGRKNTGVVEGTILLNGQPATPHNIAQVTGYVEQFDTLFACSTVRETLMFAAELRLPGDVPYEVKSAIVTEVLEILDLTSMSDFIIGNAQIQGLSPSQLKRVNIGVELVANPSVLFLDEPTTGLDSKSAQTVMRVVRRIARSGRSVVCTIHQPSAELFFLFDRLVLLGSGGHQIFFGDLGRRSKSFIQYLSAIPGVNPIPARYNPASWMLEELGVGVASMKDDLSEEEKRIAAEIEKNDDPEWSDLTPQQRSILRFRRYYFQSPIYRRLRKHLRVLESLQVHHDNGDNAITHQPTNHAIVAAEGREESLSAVSATAAAILPSSASPITSGVKPTIGTQLHLLFARNMMGYWRNPNFIFMRMVVVTILSILFGLIYLNLDINSQSAVTAYIGAIAISASFGTLVQGASSLPVFMNNRSVFYRETSSGFYYPGLWSLVNIAIEIIWSIPSTLLIQIPAYFMVGMKREAGLFFQFMLIIYIQCLIFVSIAMMTSSIAPSTPLANVIQGFYFSLSNTVNGISITLRALPRGYVWLFRLFPAGKVVEALIMPQIGDNQTVIEVIEDGETVSKTVAVYVYDFLGLEMGHYWTQFGWLILTLCVIQIIAFLGTAFLRFDNR